MSFSVRYLIASLFTLLSIHAFVYAQSDAKQKPAAGSVSGRITIKERGAAGVMVTLRKSQFAVAYEQVNRATTDHDGFYRITNVAPGTYDVMPVTPVFVADAKDTKNKAIVVGEDENVEDVNFSLVRGGVITGRVTDADGRPVIQQVVSIFPANAFNQATPQRPVFNTSAVQTDDRGVYRFFGLPPGRYKVAAGRSDDVFMTGMSLMRLPYKQVFHPDVAEQDKATVIEVSEGSEATNVDIALGRLLQTFAASGRVVDEKGVPVPNIRFGLQRRMGQRVEHVNALPSSNTQGEFVVEGLIPGTYAVYVIPGDNVGLLVLPMTFEVVNSDVEGVIVKLSKGASFSGVVVFETEVRNLPFRLTDLQIRGFVAPQGGMVTSSAASPIGPDGSFRLNALNSGTINVNLGSATSPFPPRGLSVIRIERDGVASPRGIEIRDGEDVTGVRVVLSYGTATLRGIVKTENGPIPPGYNVHLRVSKPGEPMVRPPTADARGHFLVEGIPAGTYEVTAMLVPTVPTQTVGSPPTPPPYVKREVTLSDNSTTVVTLIIDLSARPRP